MTTHQVERLDAGIEGLDLITLGGLPQGRLTLLSGTAGSGKTVFATQFLAAGCTAGEAGVFVTFEERPEAIRRNVASLGWDIAAFEEAGTWAFVDASPRPDVETQFTGQPFDLTPLLVRITDAVRSIGATRVAIDSVGALLNQFEDQGPARVTLFRIAAALEELGLTTVMTAERVDDYGPIARYGFEEFVADNVIILRNALEAERRRRTIEVLKMRGGSHLRGEHLFTVIGGRGIVIVPVAMAGFDHDASLRRMTSGSEGLDEMLHGGYFERSMVLLAGPTGAGKSLLTTHFVGAEPGRRALLHSFEESRSQVLRNAAQWGIDLAAQEEAGNLRIIAAAPESGTLEDHLHQIKWAIEDFKPDRVAIDSLTALQRIATIRGFREYVLGLSYFIKQRSLLGLVTTTTNDFLRGVTSAEQLHVSTITDTIVLLHYLHGPDGIGHAVNVLKMRGSDHDRSVREFRITSRGVVLGEPVQDVTRLV